MKNEARYLSTFGCVCWWTVEVYSWKAVAWMGIGTSCGKRQGVYAELLRSAKSARSLNCSSRSRSWELGYSLRMYTWGLSDVFLRGRVSTRFIFCFQFRCSFDEAIFVSKNEINISLCNYMCSFIQQSNEKKKKTRIRINKQKTEFSLRLSKRDHLHIVHTNFGSTGFISGSQHLSI